MGCCVRVTARTKWVFIQKHWQTHFCVLFSSRVAAQQCSTQNTALHLRCATLIFLQCQTQTLRQCAAIFRHRYSNQDDPSLERLLRCFASLETASLFPAGDAYGINTECLIAFGTETCLCLHLGWIIKLEDTCLCRIFCFCFCQISITEHREASSAQTDINSSLCRPKRAAPSILCTANPAPQNDRKPSIYERENLNSDFAFQYLCHR